MSFHDQRVDVICTWNAYNHNAVKNVEDGIERMDQKHHPDVIVLNEVAPFTRPIRRTARALNYFTHVMKRGSKRGIELEEARSTVILRGLWIPLFAAGFIKILTKWMGPHAGILRPGRTFPMILCGNPAVRIVGFHGSTGRKRFKRNRKTWQEILTKLDRRVVRWKKAGQKIVIIGDTNDRRTETDKESLRAFAKKHGMLLVHDEAMIDYALIWGFAGATYESKAKMGSDTHRYGVLKLQY